MSVYTTQLRWPIEQYKADHPDAVYDDYGYNAGIWAMLGLDEYPIYDESHRPALNAAIIRHYYFREIAFETLAQFAWYVRAEMQTCMPYFNRLYAAQLQVTDPLTDRDFAHAETWGSDETGSRNDTITSSITTNNTSSTESHDRTVFESTPMNELEAGALDGPSANYATNITWGDGRSSIRDDTETSGTASATQATTANKAGTRDYTEKGRARSQTELYLEYQKAARSIDAMVVEHLAPYFFAVYRAM